MKYEYTDNQSLIRSFEIADGTFQRPDTAKILEDFHKQCATGEHPRLIARTEDFERVRENLKSDARMQFMFARLKDESEILLEDLDEVLLQINQHREEGQPAGNMFCSIYSTRLKNFAFLYRVTGEVRYGEAVWKLLESLCELKNWRPGEFLVCGETMTHVSVAYDWCYDYLKTIDGAADKVATAIFEKGVMAGINAYAEKGDGVIAGNLFCRHGWKEADSNWNHICNTGCGLAALAVMEHHPEECGALVRDSLRSVERAFFGYAPDGGYIEGPSYWAYGTNFIACYMMALDSALGTNYGIFDVPGFAQTCYYRPYVMGTAVNPDEPGVRMHWNYHDSGTGLISSATFMWFAYKNQDPALAGMRYREIENTYYNKISRSMYAYETAVPIDFIFYDKNNFSENVQLPKDYYFKGLETVFMRSAWDNDEAIYTGLHGGWNNYNHCQLDSGNFVIDAKGIRWITELGMGNYALPGYFEPRPNDPRWTYYATRAESHNTLVINPGEKPDQKVDSYAPVIRYENAENGALAVMDLTEANGKDKVVRAQRGLLFTENRTTIVVQDEVETVKPSEIYWFAAVRKEIEAEIAQDGKTVFLRKDGHCLCVTLQSNVNEAKFELMPAVKLSSSTPMHPLEKRNKTYQKLAICLHGVTKLNLSITFRFTESKAGLAVERMKPMSEWQL